MSSPRQPLPSTSPSREVSHVDPLPCGPASPTVSPSSPRSSSSSLPPHGRRPCRAHQPDRRGRSEEPMSDSCPPTGVARPPPSASTSSCPRACATHAGRSRWLDHVDRRPRRVLGRWAAPRRGRGHVLGQRPARRTPRGPPSSSPPSNGALTASPLRGSNSPTMGPISRSRPRRSPSSRQPDRRAPPPPHHRPPPQLRRRRRRPGAADYDDGAHDQRRPDQHHGAAGDLGRQQSDSGGDALVPILLALGGVIVVGAGALVYLRRRGPDSAGPPRS